MNCVDIIKKCAEIPSFSTEEHVLHPFIYDFVRENDIGEIEHVHKNNLVVYVPPAGDPGEKNDLPLVALTAHLDKINHFGNNDTEKLPVESDDGKLTGQLDDSAGVGICLYTAYLRNEYNFPPLMLLFSEMEEHGSYIQPDQGLVSGLGAARISRHLLDTERIPVLFLTIDTTPFYRGTNGISIYSRFWEKDDFKISEKLKKKTEQLEDFFLSQYPEIKHQNNSNDYITYGRLMNKDTGCYVPSIALEPAIYPYHQIGESVFISDILMIVKILTEFLTQFPFQEITSV